MHTVQRLREVALPASAVVGVVAAVGAVVVGVAWGFATPPGLVLDALAVTVPLPTVVLGVVGVIAYLLFVREPPSHIVAGVLYLVAAAAVAFPVTNGLLPFLDPMFGSALSRSVVGVVALGILFAGSWSVAAVCAVVGYAVDRHVSQVLG